MNTCKDCPYHLRADMTFAICVWDKHPKNPTGCNDQIVRIFRLTMDEKARKK